MEGKYWIMLLLAHTRTTKSTLVNNTENDELEFDRIFKNYDPKLMPVNRVRRPPVEVTIRLIIVNMISQKRRRHVVPFDVLMQSTWYDPRLQHNSTNGAIPLPGTVLQKIWRPDLQFNNFLDGYTSSITKENALVHIFNNGTLVTSQRVTMSVFCRMEYQMFPFDDQKCDVTLESYTYDATLLRLRWVNESEHFVTNEVPDFADEWKIDGIETKRKSTFYPNAGTWDHLRFRFYLLRNTWLYLLQIHAPLFINTCFSFAGFWISYRSVPARVAIGLFGVLTVITFMSRARNMTPPTQNIRMVDIYMATCFGFVYATLVEYAIALSIDNRVHQRRLTLQREAGDSTPPQQVTTRRGSVLTVNAIKKCEPQYRTRKHSTQPQFRQRSYTMQSKINKERNHAEEETCERRGSLDVASRVPSFISIHSIVEYLEEKHIYDVSIHILDRIARYIFPIVFLLFNIIYFTTIILIRKSRLNTLKTN